MFSKVQRIWHKFEYKKMCLYGILKDDIGFYCFQGRETTKSKENTSNRKHATT
jgi:hypothetical protein